MSSTDKDQDANVETDQACAIPFRLRDGQIEFCLITSSAGRWMFPKGFVEPGDSNAETALKEAYEEAGLHGSVIGDPIGQYEIVKKGQSLSVMVVLMEVSQSDKKWPEAEIRERRWVTPKKARRLVSHPEVFRFLDMATTRLRAA